MNETFFSLSFMAVSLEIHKTLYQNKFRSTLFYLQSLPLHKYFPPFSTLEVKIIYNGIYVGKILNLTSINERIKKVSSISYY